MLGEPAPDAMKAVMGKLDATTGDAVFAVAIQELFYGIQARTVLAYGGAAVRTEPVFNAFPKAFDRGTPQRSPFRVRTDAPQQLVQDDADLPFGYITFGTLAGRSPKSQAAYRTALAAVADLPVRALLTKGPAMPITELGPIPANVTVETFARSVEASGAGIAVRDGTADALSTAWQKVLTEPACRATARRIADEIATQSSIDVAADALLGRVLQGDGRLAAEKPRQRGSGWHPRNDLDGPGHGR